MEWRHMSCMAKQAVKCSLISFRELNHYVKRTASGEITWIPVFFVRLSQGNMENSYSKVQNVVRTMYSVFAVTQGGVKSCGLWCMEASFTLLLPSIMCFCLLPCLQSATSQLGLTFTFTAFDSLSHVAQKGIAVQFKCSPHGSNTGP